MHFLYNISIYTYLFAIHVASLFNVKARLWVNGRKNIFKLLELEIRNFRSNNQHPASDLIWIHCASLGEFEQGRPLIEKLKIKDENIKFILTFFSPSGYEVRKNYKNADLIFYLPIDTPGNAKQFLKIVKPKAAIFVKYEFWFNYLEELKRLTIPTYLVSGIFRKNHYFFKVYGEWYRKQLNSFTYFFLQDEYSKELLYSAGFKNCTISGDTRFDRVAEIAKSVSSIPVIDQFKENNKILILGSTWPEDEKLISEWTKSSNFQDKKIKLIIAPHEINEEHIVSIIRQFSDFSVLRFSKADEKNLGEAKILIIDNIGMLSSVYQYGSIAYIGGGFGKGIHNILEAATFNLPVIFGPNYGKFIEAKELIQLGGAFSVSDIGEFINTISLLGDEQVLKTASQISGYYVESKVGATDKILNAIAWG
jgi:3-deoxy-D-manno-octulosonic-acid transferase